MKNTSAPPLVYRVDRIAELLGISRVTVYRLVKRKELELVQLSEKTSGIPFASLQKYCTARGIEMLPACLKHTHGATA